jgi:hypothetical protein
MKKKEEKRSLLNTNMVAAGNMKVIERKVSISSAI